MKKLLIIISLSMFMYSCGSEKSKEISKVSSNPCEDMRSYNKGIQHGKDDKGGSRITGQLSTCDGVLQYYNDNYNRDCFCKGFYKGQSEG